MLLPGFVVLAVYGAVYRLWPEMKNSGLAKAQFWLASLGVLGQVVGAYQFMRSGGTDTMLIAGALGDGDPRRAADVLAVLEQERRTPSRTARTHTRRTNGKKQMS